MFFSEEADPDHLPHVNIHRISVTSINMVRRSKHNAFQKAEPKDYFRRIPPIEKQLQENINLLLNLSNFLAKTRRTKRKPAANEGNKLPDYEMQSSKLYPRYPVFVKKTTYSNEPGLKAPGLPHKVIKYSTIVFIPVEGNGEYFYAISMGHGHKALLPFVDYEFQHGLPKKILNSESANCMDVKSMIGTIRSKSQVKTNATSLQDLEYGEVCKTYTAEIENKLKDSEGKTRQQLVFPTCEAEKIMVEIGKSRIKFLVKESFETILYAIRKLEKIHTDTSAEYIIDDSQLHRAVFRVDKIQKDILDQEMSNLIQQILRKPNFCLESSLGGFDICFKHPLVYTRCTDFKMRYGRHSVPLGENPDLQMVLQLTHKILWNKIKTPVLMEKEIRLGEFLRKIQILFGNPGDNKKSAAFYPLGQFLRGVFYSNDQQKYFLRFGTTWYTVDDDYIIGVQRRFQNILQTHLVTSDQYRPLASNWPPSWDESDYNSLYAGRQNEGFYVGDCKSPRSIEHFDVLLHKDQVSYFCHVKKGFGQTTGDVCSQIVNSLVLLSNVNTGRQVTIESLKVNLLKRSVFTFTNNEAEEQILTDETIKEILGITGDPKGKVFVMGLFINKNLEASIPVKEILSKKSDNIHIWKNNRSFEAEMTLKQEIPEDYIRKYLRTHQNFRNRLCTALGCSVEDAHEKVLSALMKNKFVKRPKSQLLVCPKLLLCDRQEDFKDIFPGPEVYPDILKGMRLMLQQFTTFYGSLGAKLEIIRCAKYVRSELKLEQNQFQICEIFADLDKAKNTSKPTPKRSKTKLNKGPMDSYVDQQPATPSASTSKSGASASQSKKRKRKNTSNLTQ
jgi:hypothetical protein